MATKIKYFIFSGIAATGFTNSAALILVACKKLNLIVANDEAASKWMFVFFVALPFISTAVTVALFRIGVISLKQWRIYLSLFLVTSVTWKLTESPQDMNMPLAMTVMNALFTALWIFTLMIYRRFNRFRNLNNG